MVIYVQATVMKIQKYLPLQHFLCCISLSPKKQAQKLDNIDISHFVYTDRELIDLIQCLKVP